MTRKTKKRIGLSLLIVILSAAAVGYYLYNKKHFSVAGSAPVATITAIDLHKTFVTDSSGAKEKFVGDENNQKVIQVTGEVAEIKKDQQGNTIVLLKTATEGAYINCTLEEKPTAIIAGNKIIIKGICNGYNFDADMGIPGDVIVTRCYISK